MTTQGSMQRIFQYQASHRIARLVAAAIVLLVFMVQAESESARAIKSRVPPNYPELARRMHVSGVVVVEAKVDTEGKVVDVKPVSGNQMLSNAAQEAVRKWRFEPGPKIDMVEVEVNFAAQ